MQKAMMPQKECYILLQKWFSDTITNNTTDDGDGDAMWDKNNSEFNSPKTINNRKMFKQSFIKSFKDTCNKECQRIKPLAPC